MIDDVKNYVEIMKSLDVRQMVLQGPPGTSKTYNAKQIIAYGICENLKEKDKFSSYKDEDIKKLLDKYQIGKQENTEAYWDMVQFHPSYGYEDFVRGITVTTENQQIKYKTINKVFGNICKLAKEDKEKNEKNAGKYFLLIDEINRADIATVFGELIYALEYRDEWVEVPYTLDKEEADTPSKISVPDNLYIIATMNTADKSVGNIDYAIRRRFLFFDLLPDENVIRKNRGLEKEKLEKEKNDIVINTFKGINKFIEDATKDSQYRANDFKIGHTYFLKCGEFKSLGKIIPYIDFIKMNKDNEKIKKEIIGIEYIEDLKKIEGFENRDSIKKTKNIVGLDELREKLNKSLNESLNESLEKQKNFLYKMQYQVLPILREYYIDGIIKIYKPNEFKSLNLYLNGEDLNPISLIEIIEEFAEIVENKEESNA